MADLLPSTPDVDPSDEPRVVGLDSEDADELIDALSSTTTRRVLASLHEEPAAASELADRVDTSLQNVQYHLRKLEDAGLVEVGDTVYSEKGREMNVYVPADRALVVVAGREEETTGLKAALSRLLGGVGVLGLASVVVDRLARGGVPVAQSGSGGGDDGAAPAAGTEAAGDAGASGGGAATAPPTATETPTRTATPEPTGTQVETATGGGGVDIAEATTTTTAPTEAVTAEPTVTAAATPTPEATALSTPTGTPLATGTPTGTVAEVARETPTETVAETATGTPLATGTATAEAAGTATAAASGGLDGLAASPGLLFFLGGATMLVGWFALWWVRR